MNGKFTRELIHGQCRSATECPEAPTSGGSGQGVPTAPGSPFTPCKKKRTFGDVVNESASFGDGLKTLEELHTMVVDELPEKCEVMDRALQDPRLRPFYKNLPNLKWSQMCHEMDFDLCISAIQFVSFKDFINPLRISPMDVNVQQIIGVKPKYNLYTSANRPAICISTIFCNASHVVDPPARGLVQKWLSGIFHTQEWERFVGFMCMVFKQPRLSAQLTKDSIQFATKASFAKARDGDSGTDKFSSMFSNVASPSVKGKGVASANADQFTLEHDVEIPVYDIREVEFTFGEDLDRLHLLPRWTGEIPVGSFVVVAYTVTVFYAEKTRKWTIGFNIQWAMVVGVPS